MAGVTIRGRLQGADRLERTLAQAAQRTDDLRPVWVELDKRITRREQQQFDTEGGLTGGWPPLAPEYLEYKARTAGLSTDIMQRSRRLKTALVNPFSPDAFHSVKKKSYERGTTLPYAGAHQEGRGVPKRPPLVWQPEDVRWLVREIQDRIFD